MEQSTNENLVAYCSLYCPKCYKMNVAEAAENLKEQIENAKTKNTEFLKLFPSLEQILDNLIKLKCFKFCRESGGKASCKIKICCKNKNIDGCWQCKTFKKCDNLKTQFINNIKEIKKLGIEGYIQTRTKN